MRKIVLLTISLFLILPLLSGCIAVVGVAGAAAGYEAHKAGYRINITKKAPGEKPKPVINKKIRSTW